MGERKRRGRLEPRLILASASPRRRILLRRIFPRFRIIPAHLHEKVDASLSPSDVVKSLALQKAVHVARNLPAAQGGSWVLGADTLVFLQGRPLGKPANPAAGRRMLRFLSGTWHKVYTGVALVEAPGGRRISGSAVTRVKMRRLTEPQIKRASRRHLDKAGAYAVQEIGDPFVEKLCGDYDNVVGLPLRLVKKLLKKAGL